MLPHLLGAFQIFQNLGKIIPIQSRDSQLRQSYPSFTVVLDLKKVALGELMAGVSLLALFRCIHSVDTIV